MVGRFCAVGSCGNCYSKNAPQGISLHRFPKDPAIRQQWVTSCKRLDPINPDTAWICSEHFTKDDFERDVQFELFGGEPKRRKLKINSVPTLKIPNDPQTPKTATIRRMNTLLRKKPENARTTSATETMVKKCSVFMCRSGLDLSYFSFPTDPDLLGAWCKAIGRSSSSLKKSASVCEKHFEPKDFWPRYASGRLSLRPNAVPSRDLNNTFQKIMAGVKCHILPSSVQMEEEAPLVVSLPSSERLSNSDSAFQIAPVVLQVEDDENLKTTSNGAISETKLPDGSVCEFYSTPVTDSKLVPSCDGSDDCDVSLPVSRTASPTNFGMDFDAIASALEQDKINLPSPLWSHTRLGRSIIIFLCWDKDLRLIKKAVLRKGSQMSLYLGDQLVADGSMLESSVDLEDCLRSLNVFEPCKGLGSKNCSWSQHCTKYTTDGKQICSSCEMEETKNDANRVNPATPPAPSLNHPVLTALTLQSCPSSSTLAPISSDSKDGIASAIVPAGHNVPTDPTHVSASPQFLVMDFVVSSGGEVNQILRNPSEKLPLTPIIQSPSPKPPSVPRNRNKPQKNNKMSKIEVGIVKKATARKSTGGSLRTLERH